MKKIQPKQLTAKQKQSMIASSALLRVLSKSVRDSRALPSFPRSIKISRGVFRRPSTKIFYESRGTLTDNKETSRLVETISADFLSEVSEFILKNPDNEYARKISNTLTKGEQIG